MKANRMAQPEPSTNADILAVARATIAREVEGLEALSAALGDSFLTLVERIYAMRGRVILTGMGKSGHIAKKIAATLASTGTPAMFVHPSEASHGDLGMITEADVVIALSNSGETHELRDIISYTRRFSIYLAAFVRRAGSMLVESADLALVLPEIPEASPTGAPTTSTTMMLALGDALAMALLERRGFTREEYAVYHPGGKLGQGLQTVEKLMHGPEELPLVAPDATMDQVLIIMTEKRFGCAGVVENDKLVGVITDGDLRRHMADGLLKRRASEVMNPGPILIAPRLLAAAALARMNEKKITALFVAEADRKPLGILHVHDCLRAGIL